MIRDLTDADLEAVCGGKAGGAGGPTARTQDRPAFAFPSAPAAPGPLASAAAPAPASGCPGGVCSIKNRG